MLFNEDGRELVLALSEHAYVTVAFELGPPAEFRHRFRDAFGDALTDPRVPVDAISVETAAVALASPARLTDGTLRGVLKDVEFFCGIELPYHTDLRIVQRNLNEVPHRTTH